MKLPQYHKPQDMEYLPAEIKTMIVREALQDTDMSFGNSKAIQLSLLHTSREFSFITRSLVAKRTLWLRYELCSCMEIVAAEARLPEISTSRRPTYAPRSGVNPEGLTLTMSACRCTRQEYTKTFLVPYQPRAHIRASHIFGKALTKGTTLWMDINCEDLDEVPPCVQGAFELMAILITDPLTKLRAGDGIASAACVGLQGPVGTEARPSAMISYYTVQSMLNFASIAVADGRYLEAVHLFCIAQMDLVDGSYFDQAWSRSEKRLNTFRQMHVHLAGYAVTALVAMFRSHAEEIGAIRYKHFDVQAVVRIARSTICQYHYLNRDQRISAVLKSARLLNVVVRHATSPDAILHVDRHEVTQCLSDLEAAVEFTGRNINSLLGHENKDGLDCGDLGMGISAESDIECAQKPTYKIRGWTCILSPWDVIEVGQLRKGLSKFQQ